MKSIIPTFILILFGAMVVSAGDMTGPEIIEKVNQVMNPETMKATMTMIIETTSGQKRTFVYESFSVNHGEKNLIRYLEPSRSKGQTTLLLNYSDDIWVYFPRTGRVRKLAEHAKRQKMEGSDFSYEDMGSGDAFVREYTARRLQDDKKMDTDCYTVELTRNEGSDAGYSRVLMWVDKTNYVPLLIDYYDLKDPELLRKRLFLSDIEIIQGIPTAKRMEMWNMIDNSRTVILINSVEYNIKLDEEMFTERGLRK
jgi:outer membrane lipoprotein-sorting protein